ncbi:MAG: NAD(P)-dependent oxidoreductase [Rhodospirillaceae bacterium]|nr:NAD(P)-dependent oxidoreductase [Rhodospirillaceae bacterium]
MPEPGHLFCFGLGYTGTLLALRLMGNGWRVSGSVRKKETLARASDSGIRAYLFDGNSPLADPDNTFAGVTHLLGSIPPSEAGDPALIHHGDDLRSSKTLRWVGYLSTPAVYGDRQGGVAREEDKPNPVSARGKRRLTAERAWVKAFDGTRVSVQAFRLAGIYGPGRCALDQVRAGTARIVDKPGQVFNRIHVDDITKILIASMARPDHTRIYNVADTEACPSGDVIRHACFLLGVDPPAPIAFESAELSPMARSFYSECKRLDTNRLTKELGVTLTHPTYREGLAAILGAT